MAQKIYLRLNNDTCECDEQSSMWRIKIPEVFTNSRNPDKKITVLNFMYIIKTNSSMYTPPSINIEFTTFHSPTLCDGNFNQDNYICTLCYNQNTVYKTYPIKSNPQYIEFYFRDGNGALVEAFWYQDSVNGNQYVFSEKFNIDLELIY